MQITWAAWIGTTRTGIATTDMRAFSMAQFSWLYEGPGVRVVYMAERLTCQLGHGDDLVPMAPLQFTLFPYEAPNEVVNQWRAGFPYLERLEEDGNFEEYQGSLMPTLHPPPAVRLHSLVSLGSCGYSSWWQTWCSGWSRWLTRYSPSSLDRSCVSC
jgi:hypothetical protein